MKRILIALISAMALPSIALAEPLLTETRLRALSPDHLARRLLGDLASITYPLPWDGRREPDGDYVFRYLTRARTSYRTGICRTEELGVRLEPVGEPGPDAPLRPRSIWTNTAFFIGDLSQARHSTVIPGVMLDRRDAVCAAIDPRQVEVIYGNNPELLAEIIGLVTDLLDAARSGRSLAPTTCVDFQGRNLPREACLAHLARLQALTLNSVEQGSLCWPLGSSNSVPGNSCKRGWLWDPEHRARVEISFEFRRGGEELSSITVRPARGDEPANY